MGEYLKPDEQAVKIGVHLVPGTVTGIEVSGELRLEKQKTDGKSGSTNLIKGYEEATIRITVELLGGDAEIKALEKIFKGYSSSLASKGVRVINRHLDARGVKRLIFKGLTTRDDYARGSTIADLSFSEYDMEAAKLEEKDKAAAGAGTGSGNNGTGADGKSGNDGNGSGSNSGTAENPIIQQAINDAKTDHKNLKQDPLGTMFGWKK
ncbi:hypothetical protein [Deinococcus cellulosilyticus]|uniref:Uncharacterized protein n=1 Tax=Deinococcus cellulosilyticus (strain DSM 18568 / NBRC 106333 / KACC 11606 / 5516J-15) TaxID=1223518 RepID=A0A511MW78_DEIC1|nr:hypothetical protein [Deinococcus cellulosilyticus]GEM44835.1 hypothetical protein DC3_04700 [Deinococcus cellulosilyticus NBRC 106333 = KACC 11606]